MLLPEFAARLSAQNLTTGFTVVQGLLPATPDTVIAIYETGGSGPDIAFGGAAVEMPAVMVVVRGAARDYATPRLAIERIYQAAMGWGAFTTDGVRYLSVTPLQAPFVRNRDATERVEFAVNFLVEKEPSPTS